MTDDRNDLEERIRRRAYRLWQEDGCPDGQDQRHWEKARMLVAIEEGQSHATKPNPVAQNEDRARRDQPVEPLATVEAQGDAPGLTDQGEKPAYPARRRRSLRRELP